MAGSNGYDANFIDNVPDHLKCVICHLAFKDPIQVSTCGHRFCSKCYENMKDFYTARNQSFCCPLDRTEIDPLQVFQDQAAKRQILAMVVKCKNKERGCNWCGDLGQLKCHLLESCGYEIVCCEKGCASHIERRMYEVHVHSCNVTIKTNEEEIQCIKIEEEEVPSRKYTELIMLKLKELEKKVETNLTGKDLEIESLQDELKCNKKEFFQFQEMTIERITALEENLDQWQKCFAKAMRKNELLSDQYLRLKEQVENNMNHFTVQPTSSSSLDGDNQHMTRLQELDKHLQTSISKYENVNESVQQLNLRVVDIEKLNPSLGVFHWKIEDFFPRVYDDKELISPPFNTCLHGMPCVVSLLKRNKCENIHVKFEVLCQDAKWNESSNYREIFNYNVLITCEGNNHVLSKLIYCNDLMRPSVTEGPVCLQFVLKNFSSLTKLSKLMVEGTLNVFCEFKSFITY